MYKYNQIRGKIFNNLLIFTYSKKQFHIAVVTTCIFRRNTVFDTRTDMIYSRTCMQNLYISYPLTRQDTPPHISRWSRLFELRSLLRAAMTRTLTRIGATRPKMWKLSLLYISFRSNIHTCIYQSLSLRYGILCKYLANADT